MSVPVASASQRPLSAIKAVFRVTAGNFLEQFDFFLFGFYATQISTTFFPSGDTFASLMMTFAVFGAGFLMRPLGAIILGAYIDDVGRKKGLIVTLGVMASGTVLIAFVPGYARIGLVAPILVLAGRLLQGFSAGAELGGVSVYLSEIATPGRKGFFTSWQSASQQVAVVAAALLGYAINRWMPPSVVNAWGWRIPFVVGCMIVPLVFLLRRNLEETEDFKSRRHAPDLREVMKTLTTNWRTVGAGMLLVAMTTTLFYFITVYAPTFGKNALHLSTADSLVVTLCIGVSNFIWLSCGGILSDRYGRRPVLVSMAVLALITGYPTLDWLAHVPTPIGMLVALLWLSFIYGLYNGAMVAALTELIPKDVRVAGFSLAYSLATAIFGGCTPIVSTALIHLTGDAAAPGYWMSGAAACALCATMVLYRTQSPGQAQAA